MCKIAVVLNHCIPVIVRQYDLILFNSENGRLAQGRIYGGGKK